MFDTSVFAVVLVGGAVVALFTSDVVDVRAWSGTDRANVRCVASPVIGGCKTTERPSPVVWHAPPEAE